MKIFSGKRLMAKLAAILALGVCSSLFPAFKYVSSVLRETDRYRAELGGARILQGLSVLSHAAFERGLSGADSAADPNFKSALASARDSIFSGAAEIARTSSYMRQASSEKHANISAIYTAESLDAFPGFSTCPTARLSPAASIRIRQPNATC